VAFAGAQDGLYETADRGAFKELSQRNFNSEEAA
jgi:hypothetical protein